MDLLELVQSSASFEERKEGIALVVNNAFSNHLKM